MTKTIFIVALFLLSGLTGCSSISLPSIPSLPWSKSGPQPDPTAEALYEDGMRYLNEKRYVRAIDAFQKIKTDHPFSPQLTEAELKLADAHYLNKQYPEAVAAFKEFQSLHPTNENIPFVLYRLGQAHFDQFTATDRDQKNTEIAKGYFEAVLTSHAKSPWAKEAREKLAKTLEYLAESDFNVAHFYFQQEKYPAARDRFEEIVRKYRDTPTAVKSLFYLGESYRKEKNGVKAALAYEALLQHYPKNKFAAEAKTQLAQLEKEKHDPLAMLLMRDRRPAAAPATQPASGQDPAIAKLKELNLVEKKEVVYEEPAEEKGIFRRVVDKINPFASSDNGKKEERKPETGEELLAQKKAAEKAESGGLLSWLNPFSGRNSKEKQATNSSNLVGQIDDSLRQKGIDAGVQQTALKPPAEALPKLEEAPPAQTIDTAKLLGQIDSTLAKGGRNVAELPAPPQAAAVFTDAAAAAEAAARAKAKPAPTESPVTSGLLSSIDQKLKSQGLEPARFEPPSPAQATLNTEKQPPRKVELEPKLAVETGPLFLSPAEIPTQEKPGSASAQEPPQQERKPEVSDKPPEPAAREIPKSIVRGSAQPQTAVPPAKPAEPKKPAPGQEEEPKTFFEQMKEDAGNIGKLLNPFSW
jgi:outer membrane protein assembly factor BamD